MTQNAIEERQERLVVLFNAILQFVAYHAAAPFNSLDLMVDGYTRHEIHIVLGNINDNGLVVAEEHFSPVHYFWVMRLNSEGYSSLPRPPKDDFLKVQLRLN